MPAIFLPELRARAKHSSISGEINIFNSAPVFDWV